MSTDRTIPTHAQDQVPKEVNDELTSIDADATQVVCPCGRLDGDPGIRSSSRQSPCHGTNCAEAGGHLVELGPLPAHVPALPFPDNPDPTQCGIPTVWGLDDPAWISRYYQGEFVQPVHRCGLWYQTNEYRPMHIRQSYAFGSLRRSASWSRIRILPRLRSTQPAARNWLRIFVAVSR